MPELTPEQEKMAMAALSSVANRVSSIEGKTGSGVVYEDIETGKVGIAFRKDQKFNFIGITRYGACEEFDSSHGFKLKITNICHMLKIKVLMRRQI